MAMQTRTTLLAYLQALGKSNINFDVPSVGDSQTPINDSAGGVLHLAPGHTYTLPVGGSLPLPTDPLIIER